MVCLFLVVGVCGAGAEERGTDVSHTSTNATGPSDATFRLPPRVGDWLEKPRGVTLGKKLRVTGPLAPAIGAIKAGEVSSLPSCLLQAINPFAVAAPVENRERISNLDARAWTTIAGWRVGASASDNPVRHESRMVLLSFNRAR